MGEILSGFNKKFYHIYLLELIYCLDCLRLIKSIIASQTENLIYKFPQKVIEYTILSLKLTIELLEFKS